MQRKEQGSGVTTVTSQDVVGQQFGTRQLRWERSSTERLIQESNVDRNSPGLSYTASKTQGYKAEEFFSSIDDARTSRPSKARVRAKPLKLELRVGTNPPYVPPTPYRHPSHYPSLPPTPPNHSSATGPTVASPSISASKDQNNYIYYEDTKMPYLPGSWQADEDEDDVEQFAGV